MALLGMQIVLKQVFFVKHAEHNMVEFTFAGEVSIITKGDFICVPRGKTFVLNNLSAQHDAVFIYFIPVKYNMRTSYNMRQCVCVNVCASMCVRVRQCVCVCVCVCVSSIDLKTACCMNCFSYFLWIIIFLYFLFFSCQFPPLAINLVWTTVLIVRAWQLPITTSTSSYPMSMRQRMDAQEQMLLRCRPSWYVIIFLFYRDNGICIEILMHFCFGCK